MIRRLAPARRGWSAGVAVLALLVGLLAGLRPAHAATLYPCVGAPADEPAGGLYAQRRQFVEVQSWWTQDGGSAEHIHMGLCLPERETLDAAVTPDFVGNVRLIMHNNSGYVTYASMVFKTADAETTVQKDYVNGLSCPAGTCQAWLSFSQPLSLFDHTGLEEIRFRVFVPEPAFGGVGGRQQSAHLNFQTAVVGTGKSLSNVSRMPYLRGKGYYPTYLYCEADLLSVPVPDGPVSGVWSPQVQQVQHSSDASLPVTHHFVTLDPDFHAMPPDVGTVLLDGAGPLPPTPLTVDTAALVNGVHRLYQRADCHGTAFLGGTNAGVLVVPFEVVN